ncbi:MAG TPA: hypothetical protein VNS58_17590 [Puia sp.]|nr:hypothetical protein [Puia sp.]
MRRLAILHFNPIELYPPVLNWLHFLAEKGGGDFQVTVFTMHAGDGHAVFVAPSNTIKIVRLGSLGKKAGMAYLNYLYYYAGSLLQLIKLKPDIVFYYETLSSFPVFVLKKYFRRNTALFIHYHEYTSKKEYEQGMVLGRWGHRLETKLYPLAEWISHTNSDRIQLFRKDLAGVLLPPVYPLPNYPPSSWRSAVQATTSIGLPVRMVYVGAMSLDTMYTREMAEWVAGQSGKVIWDIYSDNYTDEARAYLMSFGESLIRFRRGVDYYSLPGILGGYNIGLILYKGHIPNYVYNAPNKLFEYMACGLDIWFPAVMLGCHSFVTEGVYPKVMGFDFTNLSELDLSSAIDRSGSRFISPEFYAEKALAELLLKMKEVKK